MGKAKTGRLLSSILLIVFTLAFIGLWLYGWFMEEPGIAEQGFYAAVIFLAATLVYYGVRASIYE